MTTRTPRQRGDYYQTPPWCVPALHRAQLLDGRPLLDLGRFASVLDPACGGGALLQAFAQVNARAARVGLERNGRRGAAARAFGHVIVADALREPWPRAALVLMNPPYRHAEAFWRKALAHSKAHGSTVAALLREGFAHGAKRVPLHQAHPFDLVLLASRPGFGYGGARKSKQGGTDSSEYAWFVAGPSHGGRFALAVKGEP